ncbi:MAG: VTT domain-containing protein, partial [Psychromonas sp.]
MKKMFTLLRANGRSLGFAICCTFLPLLLSSTLAYFVIQHEMLLRNLDPIEWAIFFFVSIFSMAFALTPTTLIALICSYLLGWQALPYVVIAYLLASVVCFYVARIMDAGKLMNSLQDHPEAQLVIERLQQQELTLIIFSKLSPILPFAISNILLAIAGARLKYFIIGAFIGMLPRTLVVFWVGIQ